MCWDESRVGITYIGTNPLDTATPPTVCDIVKVSKSNYDVEVKITSINGSEYTGVVLAIEPTDEQNDPNTETDLKNTLDIKTGQEVGFTYGNIKSLRR